MYENFDDLKEGTRFFQERTYSGLVEFVVESKDNNWAEIASTGTLSYGFMLSRETFEELPAEPRYIFYETYEEGMDGINKRDQQETQKVVDRYENDKEHFVLAMIKMAYERSLEDEYGNRNYAEGIKKVAGIHFPELDLEKGRDE